jgi:two-component sensor histidine kinase
MKPERKLAQPGEAGADATQDYLYLANLAELVTTLTSRLVNPESGAIDGEINNALQRIGDFASVDRSYVFQFSEDGEWVSNTHEWCAEGVAPMMDQIQNAPVDQYAWAMNRFKQGEVLYAEEVDDLPPDAEGVKSELRRQGVLSTLNVPLISSGRVLGMVGFDAVRQKKAWQTRHIELLKVVGEIIAGAIERCRAHRTLNWQVEMETLVARASSRFINVSVAALDDEITRTIAEIGRFTGVDRSYVFRFDGDGLLMSNSHEWCAPGVVPHVDRLQGLPLDFFGYSIPLMKRGEIFYVEDVSKLPPQASAEKAEFEKEGIQTLINVPITMRGAMIGFLGFDAVRERKAWSAHDFRLLNLVAEIFSNAFERKDTEDRLQASLHEKELLLREIHHRVKNNLQIVDSLLYLQTQAIREHADPASIEAFRQSQSRIRAMAAIHDRLYRTPDLAAIDIREYLGILVPDLLSTYSADTRIGVEILGDSICLGIDRAIPCALIINELLTNSLKHAFPEGRTGRIEVSFERDSSGAFRVAVMDDGVGFPTGCPWTDFKTLGLRLVRDLATQMDAEVVFEGDRGTRFVLSLE